MNYQEEVRMGPIRRHPQVCGGELTFAGSRVFVDSLFDLLGSGHSIDEIFGARSEYFPTVSVMQAGATLELAVEILELISAEPRLREAVWRADMDLGALLDEDWPKDDDHIRVDLRHWSDALQRRIHVPPSALWVMANLAHEAERVPIENMTPELSGWLYRTERMVAEIVGVDSWDAATRALLIPENSRGSLQAHLQNLPADEVPARLTELRDGVAAPADTRRSAGPKARSEDFPSSGRDEIPAWRPLIEVAERACAAAGTSLSCKTVYEDLSLMPVGGASPELCALLDRLEAAANAIDPVSGALRAADNHAAEEAYRVQDT